MSMIGSIKTLNNISEFCCVAFFSLFSKMTHYTISLKARPPSRTRNVSESLTVLMTQSQTISRCLHPHPTGSVNYLAQGFIPFLVFKRQLIYPVNDM